MMDTFWRFPAEWEKQEGILLCFPYNGKDWPGKYAAVQWAFVEFIKKIATVERVFIIVATPKLQHRLHDMLTLAEVNLDHVSYLPYKTNRSWMRDAGPIVVKQGNKRKAIDFNFNGWAKYSNFKRDRQVPGKVASFLDLEFEQALYNGRPVTLEGGAIDVNGKGTLLTSEECLLDQEVQVRNPGLTKADYEAVFKTYLGVTHTIWLGDGIAGDDTHGHIDDLARFVNENTIVTVVETNKTDPNYRALQDNLNRLEHATLENGKKPNILHLPMPKPILFNGIKLPASYANFLILNNLVLVPTFNDSKDREALNILASCFPNREVIPIHAIDLIWGFGTLHCLSQQIPHGGLPPE